MPPLAFIITEYFLPILMFELVMPIRSILIGETVAVGVGVATTGVLVTAGAFVAGGLLVLGTAVVFGGIVVETVAVGRTGRTLVTGVLVGETVAVTLGPEDVFGVLVGLTVEVGATVVLVVGTGVEAVIVPFSKSSTAPNAFNIPSEETFPSNVSILDTEFKIAFLISKIE